jgi:serine/threonine-protein kinase
MNNINDELPDGNESGDTIPPNQKSTVLSEPGIEYVGPVEIIEAEQPKKADAGGLSLRYTLGKSIGKGGMGEVFEGRDLVLDRDVAVKVLFRAHAKNSPEALARFVRESEMLSLLDHPSILPIYDRGVLPNNQGPFYAMKLVNGRTLKDVLEKKHYLNPRTPESLFDVLRILIDASNAIGFAHRNGVVHRDVKPENIMIDEHGIVLVIDWGIARIYDNELNLTNANAVFGTPSYMAPEQAAGDNANVGCPADVFALGLILYQILTGEGPYKLESMPQLMDDLKNTDIPLPSSKNPLTNKTLSAICMKALSKDPTVRYSNADEFAQDLERFRNHLPVSIAPLSTLDRIGLWSKRNPAIAAAAIVVALILVIAGVSFATNQIASESYERRMVSQTLKRLEVVAPTLLDLNQRIQAVEKRQSDILSESDRARLNREQRMLGVARDTTSNNMRDSIMILLG